MISTWRDSLTRVGASDHVRWEPFVRFAERWLSAPSEADGVSDEECDAAEERMSMKMPIAVREWHRLCAKRADVVGGNNDFRSVAELEVQDGRVELVQENQGVLSWGVRVEDWEQDDPAVVCEECRVGPVGVVNSTCSEFYFQMMLHQAPWVTPEATPHATPDATLDVFGFGDVADVVAANFPRLDLPAWPWGTGAPDAFTLYGDDDTLLNYDSTQHLWVIARTSDALDRAKRIFAPHWELLSE